MGKAKKKAKPQRLSSSQRGQQRPQEANAAPGLVDSDDEGDAVAGNIFAPFAKQ